MTDPAARQDSASLDGKSSSGSHRRQCKSGESGGQKPGEELDGRVVEASAVPRCTKAETGACECGQCSGLGLLAQLEPMAFDDKFESPRDAYGQIRPSLVADPVNAPGHAQDAGMNLPAGLHVVHPAAPQTHRPDEA